MKQGKTLYIEGTSGISGDMFVGAMIDLGADLDVLAAALDSIPAEGFGVDVARVKKCGIDCVDFDVELAEDNHDHDMAYLYGEEPTTGATAEEIEADATAEEEEPHHGCCHHHGEGCGHHHHGEGCCHGHHHHDEEECHCHHHHEDEAEAEDFAEEEGHECHCHHHHEEEGGCCHHHGEGCGHHHEDGHHHHHGRHLSECLAIIEATDMTDGAKALAGKIFQIVAEAESKAHRLPIDEVHFHEVGALDSIVDIISAAVCFDNLGITDVIIPALHEGCGTVRCQHGILPVPVPATANIAAAYDLPLSIMNARGEFVTPTGAAIAAAIRTSGTLPAHFKIQAIGLGAGKRDYTTPPPFLRAMIIEEDVAPDTDTVTLLETDIDDSTGEALGYVLERLMAAGAKDAHYKPVFMKKNRPAWELTVICDGKDADEMKRIIFTETTTIGIRESEVRRTILPREERTVETPLGTAQVKCCAIGDAVRAYPEYESVKILAESAGISFRDAYRMVEEAIRN